MAQDRIYIQHLIRNALVNACKHGLAYNEKLHIVATVSITVDNFDPVPAVVNERISVFGNELTDNNYAKSQNVANNIVTNFTDQLPVQHLYPIHLQSRFSASELPTGHFSIPNVRNVESNIGQHSNILPINVLTSSFEDFSHSQQVQQECTNLANNCDNLFQMYANSSVVNYELIKSDDEAIKSDDEAIKSEDDINLDDEIVMKQLILDYEQTKQQNVADRQMQGCINSLKMISNDSSNAPENSSMPYLTRKIKTEILDNIIIYWNPSAEDVECTRDQTAGK